MFKLLLLVLLVPVFVLFFLICLFTYVRTINKAAKRRYAEFLASGKRGGVIRTPDERFANLPDYDFEPHYVEIEGLRMHYVDEGPRDADPVLLTHGEPSWSYLYRKMIPGIVKAGHRVIAPDLIGFGKSDKLLKRTDYSYQMHIDMLTAFIEKLDLKNISLFCQDWGGLIGLRAVADNQDRFDRIIVANTAIPGQPPADESGEIPRLLPRRSMIGFIVWLTSSQLTPRFNAGRFIQLATVTNMPPDVVAAYNAPFPDSRYVAGARMFPVLVPSQLKESTEAWAKLAKWEKPFLTAFSDRDPVLGGGDAVFQKVIPGAKGQPHVTTKDASHFLQEDKGEELGALTVDFIARTKAEK